VEVRRGDGVAALSQSRAASWDVIFLDPPFDSALFAPALQAASQAVARDGWVYLEAPQAWNDDALAPYALRVHRYLKAGAVHAHLLQLIA
jgi:16S rRNA G966 N2-methylase RsmD